MITIVNHVMGDDFYRSDICEKKCFRCGRAIKPGEDRLNMGSIRTLRYNEKKAELAWNIFCKRCTKVIMKATKKRSVA